MARIVPKRLVPSPGSQSLKAIVEESCTDAGRVPDLILTGHVHNYQPFTGDINGKAVITIVAGTGCYNQKLHMLSRQQFDPADCPYNFAEGRETLESFNDFQHGYLIIDVRETQIQGSYVAMDDPTRAMMIPTKKIKPFDTFKVKLWGQGWLRGLVRCCIK